MIKNLPWILCTIFAVVIIVMIVFKKDPPPVPIDHEAERKEKERMIRIRQLEETNAVLLDSMKADSIFYAKKDSTSKQVISRLTRKLKSIDTSKSTSKELDSLINVLYGQ